MLMTPVVLALATLGAGPDGAPEPVPMVATQVRVLEMKDLSWRTAAHGFLTPVARQNGATVWTASGGAIKVLVEGALEVVEAPKVTSVAGMPASVQTERTRMFVADMRFIGDFKPDDSVAKVAFRPDMDQATDGCRFELKARPIDQGTLADIQLKSRRIGAVHSVKVRDPRGEGASNRVNAAYQVPEVVEETVAGEWLIPKDGWLVIGMGPRTITEKDGKTAVRERVVVVQSKPVEAPGKVAIGIGTQTYYGQIAGEQRVAGVPFRPFPTPIAVRPSAPVVGREIVYASPAFAAPKAPSVPGSYIDVSDGPIEIPSNRHINVHPVLVLGALPWQAIPGPFATAAQAQILGIGGPVIRTGKPVVIDQQVRRTAAADEEKVAVEGGPMPRVPSRHLPGTITPDGTRAILPPLPDHGPDPASYDPSGEPLPTPQSAPHHFENVKIHGKVVIRGMDGLELIAEGLTIRTLPKADEAVSKTSATLKESEPVLPPCCGETSDKVKAGWSKPKDGVAKPDVVVGAAPLKLELPNTQGKVELEIHAMPAR